MGMDRERGVPLRMVEFHILLSLASGERHGYGIIQDIQARDVAAAPDVGHDVPGPSSHGRAPTDRSRATSASTRV